MNLYCRLPHLKTDYVNVSRPDYDAIYLRAIEAASREVDQICNRRFYSEIRTLDFDGNGSARLILRPAPGEADLLSVSALTVDDNDDGTYELTLVEGTDFRLTPVTSARKWAVELLRRGTQLSVWPRGQGSVRIAGTWGYSNDSDETGLTGTVGTTSGTSLTASAEATALVYPGDTIIVESEQMYVSAVAGTAITVVRGINGTTAATHSTAAIAVRRYPRDIEDAVRLRVMAARNEINQLDVAGSADYAKFRGLLAPYRLLGLA